MENTGVSSTVHDALSDVLRDTGRLDPLASREEFLGCARRLTAPVLVIYGSETPRRSLAEIEALAALPGIRSVRLPRGKLSVHEEFADATVEAITPFLR